MSPHDRNPLVGPVACRFLGGAFALFGLFELYVAQLIDHGGRITELVTELIPWIAIASGLIGVAGLPRLVWTYRALALSAVCLAAWLVLTWVANSGA